jgi:hypothetical protein
MRRLDPFLDKLSHRIAYRRAATRDDHFVANGSRAWLAIERRFGQMFNRVELLSLALVLADRLHLRIARDLQRSHRGLIQWYDENLELITPYLDFVDLLDEDGNIISGPRLPIPATEGELRETTHVPVFFH